METELHRLGIRLDEVAQDILEAERRWTDETTTLIAVREIASCYVLAVEWCGVDSAEARRAYLLLGRAVNLRA